MEYVDYGALYYRTYFADKGMCLFVSVCVYVCVLTMEHCIIVLTLLVRVCVCLFVCMCVLTIEHCTFFANKGMCLFVCVCLCSHVCVCLSVCLSAYMFIKNDFSFHVHNQDLLGC